ncbi:MAG: hypothetical protein V4704_11110 [Pseudomonadota bacterium]
MAAGTGLQDGPVTVRAREQETPVHETWPNEGCTTQAQRCKPVRSHLLRALLACACLFGACVATAGEPARSLFRSNAPLTVTLQAPWRELLRARRRDDRYPALLTYTDSGRRNHRIDATVESRGLTRRRTCLFPPIRIRFADPATQDTDFEGQHSLKMVTHCRSGRRSEQSYVLEMLAYQIYNLTTDHSFRVRPLDITYQDLKGGKAVGPVFAFLIEPLGDMARRNGRRPAAQAQFAPGQFEPHALSRYMLFQYLIGNTDWDVLAGPRDGGACCHNARVIVGNAPGSLLAVPYDLDSAGLVNASYAAPHESLPIKEVTQRLFRGFCVHNGALPAARLEFLGHREAIFALIEGEHRLDDSRRREALRYVQTFYDTLDNPVRFERELSGRCRK